MPEFEDLKAWPAEVDRHHNQPPLVDRVLLEFDDALRLNGLDLRVRELTASAERAPPVDSPEACGAAGDLIAMARAAREKVGSERDDLNGPLALAAKSLKARADAVLAPMETALADVQASLDCFMKGNEMPRMYVTARGRYVGTQDEARADGKGWHLELVPDQKADLIAYLNDKLAAPVEAPAPAPVEAPAPVMKAWGLASYA